MPARDGRSQRSSNPLQTGPFLAYIHPRDGQMDTQKTKTRSCSDFIFSFYKEKTPLKLKEKKLENPRRCMKKVT